MLKTDCDFELLTQLADGDADAFTRIYKQHYERIYNFVKIFLPETKDAEDITADTFIKLWNRRQHFKSANDITAFLHVTSRNACFDMLRHKRTKLEKQAEIIALIETNHASSVHEIREELMILIHNEVEKMSARMKQIYDLSYHQGLTPAQIAEKLKTSVQTVSNQKTALIKTLKQAFAHHSSLPLIVLLLETPGHLIR